MLSSKIGSNRLMLEFGLLETNDTDNTIKIFMQILRKNSCFGQLASLSLVSSQRQILHAAEHTLSAFESKTNNSEKKELEFLLWLSASSQLKPALEAFSIKPGKNKAFAAAIGKNPEKALKAAMKAVSFKPSSGIFEKNLQENFKEIQKFYSIPEAALEALKGFGRKHALQELVLEKIAFSKTGK